MIEGTFVWIEQCLRLLMTLTISLLNVTLTILQLMSIALKRLPKLSQMLFLMLLLTTMMRELLSLQQIVLRFHLTFSFAFSQRTAHCHPAHQSCCSPHCRCCCFCCCGYCSGCVLQGAACTPCSRSAAAHHGQHRENFAARYQLRSSLLSLQPVAVQ